MPEQPTELDVARAIARGDLPSPQRFGNFWLFALRITGTGEAERPALRETVYRDPRIFLTTEFLDRCNGLPVVIQHPPSKILDGAEFARRIVGTICWPYIRGTEVWGVCRIYDADAASAMEHMELSTSPAVVLRKGESEKIELKNGKHLLIEGEPYLLDHVAIVPVGVWDRGDVGSGIERSDSAMPDEPNTHEREQSREGEGSHPGTELNKLLDGLHTKLDTALGGLDHLHRRIDHLGKRVDDMETRRELDSLRDGHHRDDRRRDDRTRRDARRRDDDLDEEERGAARPPVADDCMEGDTAYASRMADAQARADGVYSMLGLTGAPRYLQQESLRAYRERLLRGVQRFSKKFKDTNLESVSDPTAFAGIEELILADAAAAATDPQFIGRGCLSMSVRKTDGGATIREFHGDPSAWMSQFGGRRSYVTAIRTRIDPDAIVRKIA